jgi:hypothetical protein
MTGFAIIVAQSFANSAFKPFAINFRDVKTPPNKPAEPAAVVNAPASANVVTINPASSASNTLAVSNNNVCSFDKRPAEAA